MSADRTLTGGPRARERPGAPPWQPWAALAGFAFLLHFVWEMLQSPLYRGMATAAHWPAVRACTAAAAGDAAITLVAYAVVAAGTRERLWLGRPTRGRVGAFLAAGLLVALGVEYVSVHVLLRWAAAPGVPTLAGVGIALFPQWILLPLATLWLARRHLGWTPYRPARNT